MKVCMQNDTGELSKLLVSLKGEEYCYLTTIGRVTGKQHEIEIWFGADNTSVYLLSGGMDRSDWVKNLLKDSTVKIRIAEHTFTGIARLVKDEAEETWARNLLADKYKEREADGSLSVWAQTALVVGIDVSSSRS